MESSKMKTLPELIKCVEREIKMREAVYPGQVRAEKLSEEKAAHEIQCMKDILALLQFKGEQDLAL